MSFENSCNICNNAFSDFELLLVLWIDRHTKVKIDVNKRKGKTWVIFLIYKHSLNALLGYPF